MRKSQTILYLAVFLLTALFSGVASAKEATVEVAWPHAVYCGIKPRKDMLISASDKAELSEIAGMVTGRLHALAGEGKLPFSLKEDDSSFEENKTEDGGIAIIPLLMDDHVYGTYYNIEGEQLYTCTMVCQIDILLCSYSETEQGLRCLYNLPLIGHKKLGPFKEPPSRQMLRKEYLDGIRQLVEEDLQFKDKKFLKNLEFRKITPETYQVTDVDISSGGAYNFYKERYVKLQGENGLPLVKAMIGANYTSKFAALHPELVVLPSALVGNWVEDGAKGVSMLSLSDSGKYIYAEGSNKIKLDLFRLAMFDIPLKNKAIEVYTAKGVAAGIRDAATGKEAFYHTELRFQGHSDGSSKVEYPLISLFAEVISGAAKELAEQK